MNEAFIFPSVTNHNRSLSHLSGQVVAFLGSALTGMPSLSSSTVNLTLVSSRHAEKRVHYCNSSLIRWLTHHNRQRDRMRSVPQTRYIPLISIAISLRFEKQGKMSSQVQGVKVAGTVKFLEGFVVFFSGVEEARRTKAKEVVVRFGGKCADKFSNAVTCGVIERVGASGFKELITSKVHIVSMRWLLDCASSRALAPMESVQYKVPPFLGLVIVCTQVDIDERDRVQELVKKNGGTFCERFVGGQCTHLIAKTPTGDKFLAAKKCGNVNIVTNGWVEECAKQKGNHHADVFSYRRQLHGMLIPVCMFYDQCGCRR